MTIKEFYSFIGTRVVQLGISKKSDNLVTYNKKTQLAGITQWLNLPSLCQHCDGMAYSGHSNFLCRSLDKVALSGTDR